MKRLDFRRSNNLSQLHDEICAAIPVLAPIRDELGEGTPVISVYGKDDDIWLTVPDDADEAAIQAVVDAHKKG